MSSPNIIRREESEDINIPQPDPKKDGLLILYLMIPILIRVLRHFCQ